MLQMQQKIRCLLMNIFVTIMLRIFISEFSIVDEEFIVANTSEAVTHVDKAALKEEANQVVSKYTGWAAGSGAIPFPLWDVAAVATLQVAMLRRLFEIYETPFSESKARSIITVLIGSLSPRLLAGATAMTLFKVVPGVGHVLASMTLPMLAAASNYAVGKVMISHLEGGGNLKDFDTKSVKSKFREAFEEGKKKVKNTSNKED